MDIAIQLPRPLVQELSSENPVLYIRRYEGIVLTSMDLKDQNSTEELNAIHRRFVELVGNSVEDSIYHITILGKNPGRLLTPELMNSIFDLRKHSKWKGELVVVSHENRDELALKAFSARALENNIAIIYADPEPCDPDPFQCVVGVIDRALSHNMKIVIVTEDSILGSNLLGYIISKQLKKDSAQKRADEG